VSRSRIPRFSGDFFFGALLSSQWVRRVLCLGARAAGSSSRRAFFVRNWPSAGVAIWPAGCKRRGEVRHGLRRC